MTHERCDEIELLIDGEAQGLSEAERLRVESHIGDCASCRGALAMTRFVRDTITTAPHHLSDTGRHRAIGRALARTGGMEVVPDPKRRVAVVGGTLSLFAIAAVALLMFAPSESSQRAENPPASAPRSGAIAAPSVEAPLSPQVESVWITAAEKQRHTFAHATVELTAGTRVRFDERQTTLALEQGRVEVDVDVSKGRRFAVTTQHFRVEVLGTRFAVTPETVVVERGRVQVFDLHGDVLARDLGKGASFSYGATPKSPTVSPSAQPLVEPAEEPVSATALSAAAWLARARNALAQGNTEGALRLIGRAEKSNPRRGDSAEAATLRAEVALLDKDPKAAVRMYERVSARFSDLAAGENAAFAAAQLAARAEPGRERQLLERYLTRFPRGRFVDEVKLRLAKLDAR